MIRLIDCFLILIISVFAASCGEVQSQSEILYSKDGFEIGEKSELISGMKIALKKNSSNAPYIDQYCECLVSDVLSQLTTAEFEEGTRLGTMGKFFEKPKIAPILESCIIRFGEGIDIRISDSEEERDRQIDVCVRGFQIQASEEGYEDMFSEEEIHDYCECAIDELYANGFTMDALLEESSEVNAIIEDCAKKLLD